MLCFLTALEVMELFCKVGDNGIAVFPLLVLILIFLFLLFPGRRRWRW
jgi:hypothetical protein